MAMSWQEANAAVTAPGQIFELIDAEIRGVKMQVFKNAPAHLGQIFAGARGHGDKTFLVYEGETWTFTQAMDQVDGLANLLVNTYGVKKGDRVAVAMRNYPEWVMSFAAIISVGAVNVSMNSWWTEDEMDFALVDSGATVLICDQQRYDIGAESCAKHGVKVLVARAEKPLPANVDKWEVMVKPGAPHPGADIQPDDDATILYTSGTTGDPKGVVTHHRGAYLNAVSNAVTWHMPHFPRYLWTLPMFHCNGWCFPWTIAMLGGVHVCLRRVEAAPILQCMSEHQVDHYCAAPIVHNLLLAAPAAMRSGVTQTVKGMVAGAAPPASMIEGMAQMGFDITHVYGLTEVYGPASVAVKRDSWATESLSEQVRLNGRQGVRYPLQESMTVLDPETMQALDADGTSMGEIMFQGNLVMKGYLKNPAATVKAFEGGWFHTGDLAVLEPDRYVKIKDRSKDIIISGGENISSIEVEDALYRHSSVMACAVVAKPDSKWGEVPVAFVELKPQSAVTEADLISHCKTLLASYKAPKEIRFELIPKTSTGKIQKFQLREKLKT